jgi:hypothetical protein
MKPTESSPANVHRSLHLGTPLTDGADVRALQSVVAASLKHYKIDWLPLKVDGQFGPQTLHAARFLSWVFGLGNAHRKPIKKGNLAEATQQLLRNPEHRSRADRRRAKRRQPRLEEIRKAQSEGPLAAIAYAESFIGTTENPAGTNTGPTHTNVKGQKGGVSFWESYWGLGACYWCLCFACYCVKAVGGARISGNCAYSVAIEGYARNHENGWIEVSVPDSRPGDVSIWKFDGPSAPSDHGELVVEAGVREDIGGNTSSDNAGSQSNGGGVFAKHRDLSQLSMVARPLYS